MGSGGPPGGATHPGGPHGPERWRTSPWWAGRASPIRAHAARGGKRKAQVGKESK